MPFLGYNFNLILSWTYPFFFILFRYSEVPIIIKNNVKALFYLNVVHDLGLKECLGSIVHDLVAELGLSDVLPQLLDASSLGWGTVLVNDLNEEKSCCKVTDVQYNISVKPMVITLDTD